MTSKKSILRLARLAVIFSVTIGFFSFTGCAKKEPEVYKIGAILPLTGSASFYGEWGKKGMDLAVEEINQEGGIAGKRIKIIYGDSKNDPKEGVSWMNKFMMEKMPVVVSAMTGVSFSIMPIAEKNNTVLFMTIVTHPEAADRSLWAFRHYVNKGKAAEKMASFARKTLNIETSAVLFVNDEGGIGEKNAFISKFEELGGKIVAEESFEKTDTELRGHLLKLTQYNSQSLYLSGYGKVYGLAIKQMKELNIKMQLLASYEPLYKTTRELAGEGLEGVIFTSPFFEKENPSAEKFMEKYTERHGNPPELDAGFGYDVINLIVKAIKEGGYTPERIRKSLLEIKDFPGVMGDIDILPNGDSRIPLVIRTVKNGQIVPY